MCTNIATLFRSVKLICAPTLPQFFFQVNKTYLGTNVATLFFRSIRLLFVHQHCHSFFLGQKDLFGSSNTHPLSRVNCIFEANETYLSLQLRTKHFQLIVRLNWVILKLAKFGRKMSDSWQIVKVIPSYNFISVKFSA